MSNNNETPVKPFVALTPVDDEQIYYNYKDALDFALDEKEIHNIGLTGPYGSGKSSVIKSYESRAKKGKFLNISLASFSDINQSNTEQPTAEPRGETSKQPEIDIKEIEKGILQQIIFSVPQTKLPFSRLNRIKEPYRPNWITGLLFGWLLLAACLYQEKEYFITFEFLNSKLWLIAIWYMIFGYLLAIPVLLFKDLYISIHKISFKEISYGKAKIVSDDFKSESIFNQFLDEIIYFFLVSKINVVVFEDIDRFNKPEIFVKLREINKIVNDNLKHAKGDVKSIKFIYLLKDSIFNEDDKRTKFFDFIIPIIPVINDFNSSEKIKHKSHNIGVEEVKENFLEDIAFYVYDLRLINNIFNEYKILKKQLNAEDLDKTKLLAIVVYKNIYPSDFEKLHHRGGALYRILNIKHYLINKNKDTLNKNIAELSAAIKRIDREIAKNINELTNIYMGHIIKSCGVTNGIGLIINGNFISYSGIQDNHLIELSKTNEKIIIRDGNGNQHMKNSFSNIEKELNEELTFGNRKSNIENNDKKEKYLNQLNEIYKKLNFLEKRKISELLKEDHSSVDEIFKEEELENGDLLRFMLVSNYIDEDYYLYISMFHEGTWSSNDRDFLISVKSYKKYEPDYKVDNPFEVLQRLRNDFSSKQLLNVNIFDCILNNSSRYAVAFAGIERYLLDHEQELKIFIDKYIEKGNQRSAFMKWISKSWANFNDCFIESADVSALIKNAVLYVDFIDLNEKSKKKVRELININADQILTAEFKSYDFEKLIYLDVKIKNISFSSNDDLLDFIVENNLYEINVDNLRFLMKEIPGDSIEEKNYSSISTCFSSIKEYIHLNIEGYVNNVFLELPINEKEEEFWLADLLKRIEDQDLQQRIIDKQVIKISDLSLVNESLHQYLFATNKVFPNWKNFGILIDLLDHDELQHFLKENYEELSTDKVPEDNIGPISNFIYSAVNIDDSVYKQLIDCIGYTLPAFPDECSNKKKEILIENGCMELTNETYASVEDDNLQALLVVNDIDNFSVAVKLINESVCRLILESDKLDRDQKLNICYLLTHAELSDINIKITIAEFLAEEDFDDKKFPDTFLKEIIELSKNTDASVKLITHLIDVKDRAWILDTISKLGNPYSKISEPGGGKVVLPTSEANINLARKLQKMQFVSTVTIRDEIEIQKFRNK
jgi:hypothetical protein